MSKCRSMYAGSSGAVYNANTMHPGNGNGKWQGLVSTTNMRSSIIPYVRTRADSDNRNVVFCMNQLGGVGRKSTMFASTADGVKLPCQGQKSTSLFKILQNGNSNNLNIVSTNNSLWVGSNVTTSYGNLTDAVMSVYDTLVHNRDALDHAISVTQNTKALSIPILTIEAGFPPSNLGIIDSGEAVSSNPQLVSMAYLGTSISGLPESESDSNGFLSSYNGENGSASSSFPGPALILNPIQNGTLTSAVGVPDPTIVYLPSQ